MSKQKELTSLQNVVLSHFLTEWNPEHSFHEIFKEDNPDTTVWVRYEDWDLITLKNHILDLISSIEQEI